MSAEKRITYLQYTNPGVLPPLQLSAAILASRGWFVNFLGIQLEGDAGYLKLREVPGIQVEQLRRYGSGWRLKVHYFIFVLWTWYKVVRRRPAVLYISDPITTPVGAFLSLVTSLPIIYHEHDSPFEVPRGRTERLLTRTRNFLARRATLCVLPNDTRAEEFSRAVGSARVLRVMNCPSANEVRGLSRSDALAMDKLQLYYHGSIVPDRVPLALLDSMRLLPDSVHLVVVGYQTIGCRGYLKDLKAGVVARGLETRVTLVGPVSPRNELLKLCSRHDLGLALLPMQTEDPNVRASAGASNKVFEYLACGLPVLVSDLPDHQRLFVDAGFAKPCNPDSAESIANAIRWFLLHRPEAAAMGDRGRRRVLDDWNYETQFQPVLDFLSRKLCASRRAATVSSVEIISD